MNEIQQSQLIKFAQQQDVVVAAITSWIYLFAVIINVRAWPHAYKVLQRIGLKE